jgi:hypothetical protein
MDYIISDKRDETSEHNAFNAECDVCKPCTRNLYARFDEEVGAASQPYSTSKKKEAHLVEFF